MTAQRLDSDPSGQVGHLARITISALAWLLAMAASAGAFAADEKKGYALRDLLQGVKIHLFRSSDSVSINYPDGITQSLAILARGDYNHNGIQDLLVESVNSKTGGGGRPLIWQMLYVLTRDAANGRFKVLTPFSATSQTPLKGLPVLPTVIQSASAGTSGAACGPDS